MKIVFSVITILFLSYDIAAQQIDHKVRLNAILIEFMKCIETKDSVHLYELFHHGRVTWIGVYSDITQNERLKKDSSAANYKISDYKTWFRNVCQPSPRREDFHNINIIEDGNVASVSLTTAFGLTVKKAIGEKSFGI